MIAANSDLLCKILHLTIAESCKSATGAKVCTCQARILAVYLKLNLWCAKFCNADQMVLCCKISHRCKFLYHMCRQRTAALQTLPYSISAKLEMHSLFIPKNKINKISSQSPILSTNFFHGQSLVNSLKISISRRFLINSQSYKERRNIKVKFLFLTLINRCYFFFQFMLK